LASMGLTTEEQKAVQSIPRGGGRAVDDKLVILDFWAEWCGPCKQLTPVLEKVAANYADKGVVLAKVNVDENGFIAAQFQVRSIPTVYAIFQGQPVADLTSARTEPQLRRCWIRCWKNCRFIAGGQTMMVPICVARSMPLQGRAGRRLEHDGEEQPMPVFDGSPLALDPNMAALAGMLRSIVQRWIARRRRKAIYDSLGEDQREGDAALDVLAAHAVDCGRGRDPGRAGCTARSAVELRWTITIQAWFDLANALMAAGDRDGAADALLHIIAADREWNEGAAQSALARNIRMIGLEDPWVSQQPVVGLSAILFG
jgi:putative thioredoxin